MSCDKVRYRNNGFLELVCVCGTDAAGWRTAHASRACEQRFVRYCYALLTDKTALQMQDVYNNIIILCIFATSGGVYALT